MLNISAVHLNETIYYTIYIMWGLIVYGNA